ncbi:hypothetical protein [Chlorobium sp.]|nr:hypothetical protein [Chlorobium sp.]
MSGQLLQQQCLFPPVKAHKEVRRREGKVKKGEKEEKEFGSKG